MVRNERRSRTFALKGDVSKETGGSVNVNARCTGQMDAFQHDVFVPFTHDATLSGNMPLNVA